VWELAEALDMAFVYVVEFLELPRDSGIDAPCEHGNAILSRYDLGNVEAIRHEANRSWYIPEDEFDGSGEPRLGGRVAIKADIRVGGRFVHLYSLHFESHPSDGEYRDAQAVELAEHGLEQPFRVIQGGDSNAPAYWLDLANGSAVDQTTQAWLTRGYVDTHAALRPEDRATTDLGVVIDVMFTTSTGASDARVCEAGSACDGLSDHLPIWATLPVSP
jgi:endonuclease/exonuclease/phosphatase family metal-dependent hydrolase